MNTKRAHLEAKANEHADKIVRYEAIRGWGNVTESHYLTLVGEIEFHREMLATIEYRLSTMGAAA